MRTLLPPANESSLPRKCSERKRLIHDSDAFSACGSGMLHLVSLRSP